MYNIFYQLLVIVLPLITAPYISRTLGAENVGIYSYTYSVAYYFMLIATLGIANHGNRSIAMCRDDKKKLSKTFSEIYTIQLTMFVIAIVLYIAYTVIFVKEYNIISWLQLIYIISGLMDISWLFFGLEKFKITVTRNTVIKLLTVISMFLFVKGKNDLWIYTLIMATGTMLSQAYLWFQLKKILKFKISKYDEVKKHIKPILILFIPVIAYSIYKVMDKIMLGNMSTFEEVGFYQSSEKIINIPMGVITALGTVMMPRMSNIMAKGTSKNVKEYIRISFKSVTLIGSALTFGIIGTSKVLAPVYFGNDFSRCSSILALLALTVFSLSWANICRTQYLIPAKEDKAYIKSTIYGAAVNLIINILLIPKYGASGAAIGTIFAEFTVMIFQVIAVNKKIPVIKYIFSSTHYIINGLLMMTVVYMIGQKFGNHMSTLLIQIIVGGIIYTILTLISIVLFKDDILNNIKIKNKLSLKNLSAISKYILLIIVVLTIALTITLVLRLNILPNKYLILFVIGELILLLISLIQLLKNRILKVIGIVISIISILINIFGLYYINNTNKFIQKNFTGDIKNTSIYYIITNKENIETNIDNIEELMYYKYSYNIELAKTKLEYNYKEIENIENLELNNEYLLIDENNYKLLKEEYKIIYEFNIETTEKRVKTKEESYNIFIGGRDFTRTLMDFNMIITINTKTKTILFTSIPRDYYIYVPDYNMNDSLEFIGILKEQTTMKSLENLFDTKIDLYTSIYTEGLVEIVDLIGGIEYCSDKAFTTTHAKVLDTYNDSYGEKLTIKKGCQHLNGIETLTLARERKQVNSDRERQKNCSKIMQEIIKKLKTKETLTNYDELLNKVSDLYQTNIDKETMQKLVKSIINNKYTVLEQSVDGTDGYNYIRLNSVRSYVMYPNKETVESAKAKIKETLKGE
jgi:LCP family protein required for cell wall assembly